MGVDTHGAAARRGSPITAASAPSAVIQDPVTGVAFPATQSFWGGEEVTCLGSAARVLRVLVITAKVYSVALYVDAARMGAELAARAPQSDGDMGTALVEGRFDKALVVHLVRDVEGKTFAHNIKGTLSAAVAASGAEDALEELLSLFRSRKLPKNSEAVLLWSAESDDLQVVIKEPSSGGADYSSAAAVKSIQSRALAHALFDSYLGPSTVLPQAKAVWVASAKRLALSHA